MKHYVTVTVLILTFLLELQCQTPIGTIYRTLYRVQQVAVNTTITQCCPGFTSTQGVCKHSITSSSAIINPTSSAISHSHTISFSSKIATPSSSETANSYSPSYFDSEAVTPTPSSTTKSYFTSSVYVIDTSPSQIVSSKPLSIFSDSFRTKRTNSLLTAITLSSTPTPIENVGATFSNSNANFASMIGGTAAAAGVLVGVAVTLVSCMAFFLLCRPKLKLGKSTKSEMTNPCNAMNKFYENGVIEVTDSNPRPDTEENLTTNVYDSIDYTVNEISQHVYDDIEVKEPNGYEVAQTSHQTIAEAEASDVYETMQVCSQNESSTKEIVSTGIKSDYIVPAMEEQALYVQLDHIKTNQIQRSSIELTVKIGSGQFGDVFQGKLKTNRDEVKVAVKTLKKGAQEEDRVKFLQEAATMGQFKHPNVLYMYGLVTEGEPIHIVLELLKADLRKELRGRSKNNENVFNEHILLSYCCQVAIGMAYLSSKGFIHRDLAARNILVSEDDTCKIADFGLSRDMTQESCYVSKGGKIPLRWTAPEAVYHKKYSSASDIWSYAMVMYEIWSLGQKPYKFHSNSDVIKFLSSGYRLAPPPGCPRTVYSIMIECWHPESTKRPTFTDLVKQLSLSDSTLLHWSEEDCAAYPEAVRIGADLEIAEDLFSDLQKTYTEK